MDVRLKTASRGQYQPGNLEALPACFPARHPHAKMEHKEFAWPHRAEEQGFRGMHLAVIVHSIQ